VSWFECLSLKQLERIYRFIPIKTVASHEITSEFFGKPMINTGIAMGSTLDLIAFFIVRQYQRYKKYKNGKLSENMLTLKLLQHLYFYSNL